VFSTVTWGGLGENVENLTLTGSSAIDGTGNGIANVITGNSAANKLNGDGGNDTLKGEGGNDVLTGGAGSDIFYFNAGNDTITDFSAGERIYVQLASIDLASEVRVNGDVYTFAGYDGATTSLMVHGEEPISIYYDSSASALVMAA
jgi:Ca2+-binding RTX toxin-like protein